MSIEPAPPFTPDLDAYFQRIGDSGPRQPTLAALNRIIAAHVRTIPFENLDILLGRPISISPKQIEQKLVHDRRGGYCFEQNGLMFQILQALGYTVHALSARVRIQRPREFTPARTHQFLRVELDGQFWIVDVGVGGLSPTAALALVLDESQPTPHEPRRIIAVGDWTNLDQRAPDALLYHQVQLNGHWEDVCEFTLEAMHPIDQELANWYTSAHPNSHFRNLLTVARATDTGRVTLLNRVLKHRKADGSSQTCTLNSDDALLAALKQEFGLNFPADTVFNCEGLH